MQEFYRAIHGVVAELMYASNLYIALYDEERQLISWPYFVDEVDRDVPDPNKWERFGSGEARGMTAYVLRTGKPQHLSGEQIDEARRARRDRTDRRSDRGLAGGSARVQRRPDGRRSRRAVVPAGFSLHGAGRGAARIRRPARRRRPLESAGDRGDAPAQRRARADQQRPGQRSPANSSCRRSTTPSATGSATSSTRRCSTSASTTRPPACSTFRTRSSAACGSRTSRWS